MMSWPQKARGNLRRVREWSFNPHGRDGTVTVGTIKDHSLDDDVSRYSTTDHDDAAVTI
jgi:hypothetical protein